MKKKNAIQKNLNYLIGKIAHSKKPPGNLTKFGDICGLSKQRILTYTSGHADPGVSVIKKIVEACRGKTIEYNGVNIEVTADWLIGTEKKKTANELGDREFLTGKPGSPRYHLDYYEMELLKAYQNATEDGQKGAQAVLDACQKPEDSPADKKSVQDEEKPEIKKAA